MGRHGESRRDKERGRLMNKATRTIEWKDGRGAMFPHSPTLPLSHSAMPGPDDILRRVLPNGITVLARENWAAPSVVVEGYLQVGNLDEPAACWAVSSFTSAMLTRGTRNRSFTEINEIMEGMGASVGFGADHHITNFSTKSLVEDLDLVLDILADELRNPVFPVDVHRADARAADDRPGGAGERARGTWPAVPFGS